jgi:hypothetical protein
MVLEWRTKSGMVYTGILKDTTFTSYIVVNNVTGEIEKIPKTCASVVAFRIEKPNSEYVRWCNS